PMQHSLDPHVARLLAHLVLAPKKRVEDQNPRLRSLATREWLGMRWHSGRLRRPDVEPDNLLRSPAARPEAEGHDSRRDAPGHDEDEIVVVREARPAWIGGHDEAFQAELTHAEAYRLPVHVGRRDARGGHPGP